MADASARVFQVNRLTCDDRINPIGLQTEQIRFGWKMSGYRPGLRQSAYQIRVSTEPDPFTADRPVLWDSGRIESSQAQHIPYAGPALVSSRRYHWGVRVWGDRGGQSADPGPQTFVTGVLEPREWRAHWITMPRTDDQPLPLFRRNVTIDRPLAEAYLHICGLGQYEARLNGRRISDQEFDPGWTDYHKTCLYSSYDLTGLLRIGENALGVMLGNGFFHIPRSKRYKKYYGSFGQPMLIAQLHLHFTDGTQTIIGSDARWKAALGPLVFSCIYGGEDCDAQREQAGWDSSGFDDSTWTPADECTGPTGQLQAPSAAPVKVAQYDRSISLNRLEDGTLEADFGLNLSGRPVLKLKGPAGSRVTVTVAEVRGKPWKGHSYTFILKGQGEELFRPRFSSFSFQYAYISGAAIPFSPARGGESNGEGLDAQAPMPPVLLEAGRDFLTSSVPPAGAFTCSNPLLNDINAMIDRSVRSNMWSVFTDCPHREKLGWQEQVHLMGPSILYRHDAAGLMRKVARDQTDGQYEDGRVSGVCPDYIRWGRDRNRWVMSAEWGSAAVQMPWIVHRFTGDRALLERQYETMKRYTDYLATTRNDQGLCEGCLGDWYDWRPVESGSGHNAALFHGGWENYSSLTPLELPATAFLYDNARIMQNVAGMLDQADDAERFARLAATVRQDFQTAYWDASAKSVSTGSQAALATALEFDLVPQPHRDPVLRNLIADIEKMNYRPTAGEVCWPMVIRALAGAGRSDIVYRMINRTDKPGYGYMLSLGFKTMSETWDGPGSSMNHFMFGHIQEWFFAHLLGIDQQPGSAGFLRLLLRPQPVGDLTAAAGHYDGPQGRIESRWKIENGRFGWDVVVPPNTTAELHIPTIDPASVSEGGAPAASATGLRFVRFAEDHHVQAYRGVAIYEATAGAYRFEARMA